MGIRSALLLLLLALLVAGCSSKPKPGRVGIADAVPRAEPESRYGNPDTYTVQGKTYRVRKSNHGYRERGIASWYGPGFHGKRTASGELYNMYAMTAAHTTLRLPAYVRVTNLENGRSVVVRINDRGPFVDNRIIDLSYAAAKQLDMISSGTARVEIEVVDPIPVAAIPAASYVNKSTQPLFGGNNVFIQVGAFSKMANAHRLMQRLQSEGLGPVREQQSGGITRVWIGPLGSAETIDAMIARLNRLGLFNLQITTAP